MQPNIAMLLQIILLGLLFHNVPASRMTSFHTQRSTDTHNPASALELASRRVLAGCQAPEGLFFLATSESPPQVFAFGTDPPAQFNWTQIQSGTCTGYINQITSNGSIPCSLDGNNTFSCGSNINSPIEFTPNLETGNNTDSALSPRLVYSNGSVKAQVVRSSAGMLHLADSLRIDNPQGSPVTFVVNNQPWLYNNMTLTAIPTAGSTNSSSNITLTKEATGANSTDTFHLVTTSSALKAALGAGDKNYCAWENNEFACSSTTAVFAWRYRDGSLTSNDIQLQYDPNAKKLQPRNPSNTVPIFMVTEDTLKEWRAYEADILKPVPSPAPPPPVSPPPPAPPVNNTTDNSDNNNNKPNAGIIAGAVIAAVAGSALIAAAAMYALKQRDRSKYGQPPATDHKDIIITPPSTNTPPHVRNLPPSQRHNTSVRKDTPSGRQQVLVAQPGVFQAGWTPVEMREDMRALEDAAEGLILSLRGNSGAHAALVAYALGPLNVHQLEDRMLLREAMKSSIYCWLKDFVWTAPTNWIQEDVKDAPLDVFRELWEKFRADDGLGMQVPRIAGHLAHGLGLTARGSGVEMLGEPIVKALHAVVEAAMKAWLRMKGINSKQRILVSAFQSDRGWRELEDGKHSVRRTVEPCPPYDSALLPPNGAGKVLLTCKPGVVLNRAEVQKHGVQQKSCIPEDVVAVPPRDLPAMV